MFCTKFRLEFLHVDWHIAGTNLETDHVTHECGFDRSAPPNFLFPGRNEQQLIPGMIVPFGADLQHDAYVIYPPGDPICHKPYEMSLGSGGAPCVCVNDCQWNDNWGNFSLDLYILG